MDNNNQYLNAKDISYQVLNTPQITFEVTDACNLKCQYCGYGEFYNDYDERMQQYLSVKRAFLFLDYLKELWTENITNSYLQQVYISFYGGEPLLNMELIKQVVNYIEFLNITSKKFVFSMTTNAMLLDRYIDYLEEKDFRLLISLDGNEEGHSYRVDHAGKNSFDKVFRNISKAQQEHPRFFESNVNFNTVLHNRNSVEESYEFIKKEFGKKTHISELNNSGIRKDKKELFIQTYRNKNENLHQSEHYEKIQEDMFYDSPDTQSLGIYLRQYSGNVFHTYNSLLFGSSKKKTFPTGTCMPFSKKMFVTVTGKIFPCEHIGHQYALGKITDTEVILNFEEIAERYNTWLNKLVLQCSHCYNAKACIQCIFNLDNLEQNPQCKGIMNKEVFARYQNKQLGYLAKYPHLYEKIMNEVILR